MPESPVCGRSAPGLVAPESGLPESGVGLPGSGSVFTNTYVDPVDKPADSNKPDSSDTSASDSKQIPQTGDTNNAMLPIMFAVAAAACIVIGVALSRKK